MAEVREEGEFGSSVDEVWTLVGDFGGLMEAMGLPVTVEGDGVGATRIISMGGDPTVERLEELDADKKKVVYSILSGPLPVADYVSTMQLSAAGDGRSKLVWSSTFKPGGGATEDDAVKVVTGIYQGGIGFLQSRFGA